MQFKHRSVSRLGFLASVMKDDQEIWVAEMQTIENKATTGFEPVTSRTVTLIIYQCGISAFPITIPRCSMWHRQRVLI